MELSLQAKLGSLVVHVEEGLGPSGHHFDLAAIEQIVEDPEVQDFVGVLRTKALVPEKR